MEKPRLHGKMKRKEQKECRTLLKAPLWQSRKGCSSTSLNVAEVVESDWKKKKSEEETYRPEERVSKAGAAKQGDHCHFGKWKIKWLMSKRERKKWREWHRRTKTNNQPVNLHFSILTKVNTRTLKIKHSSLSYQMCKLLHNATSINEKVWRTNIAYTADWA